MMPLYGLRDKDGTVVPLSEIDPVRDAERLGGSPATIAMILRSVHKRDGLEDGFTASMTGKPVRQLLLEETVPYSKTVGEFVAAEMGTLKHSHLNVPGDRIIANVRVYSTRLPWLSGELDNAAIVDIEESEAVCTCGQDSGDAVHIREYDRASVLAAIQNAHDGTPQSARIQHTFVTSTPGTVTFVLDLYDLKSGGFYAAKLMHKNPWGKDAHTDYAWQLNCLATILEEEFDPTSGNLLAGVTALSEAWSSIIQAISGGEEYTLFYSRNVGKRWRIRVRNLYIEWCARDSSYKHIPEAKALGIWQHQNIIIPIPRKPAEEVYAEYERKRNEQLRARELGYSGICPDTWFNKKEGKHLRCEFYCPREVRESCIRMSLGRGEKHHLATTEQALEASIARKEGV